jgi:broad specificity phosphatase PhoE
MFEADLREWDILPSYRGHPARTAWKYLCRATEWLRPPEGEAIEDLAWRGVRVCERIASGHQGYTVALCGHKALFRATCHRLVWASEQVKGDLELSEGNMLWLWREQSGQWIALPLQSIISNTRNEEAR